MDWIRLSMGAEMKNRYSCVAMAVLLCAGTACAQTVSPSNAAAEEAMASIPRILVAGAMNEQDAALLASQHSAIVRAARIYGYDLEKGIWTTSQAVCPGAPGYLIAQMSEGDTPARSFFTALIPRERGSLRIIPILHQGYLNSWMFGEDKLQREFIDQMIPVKATRDEQGGTGWSNLAGCYAALEGAEIAGNSFGDSVVVDAAAGKPREMHFTGIQPNGQQSNWLIQYDAHGKIRNMEVAGEAKFRVVRQGRAPRPQPSPASTEAQQPAPPPSSSHGQQWKPVPSSKAEKWKPIPAPSQAQNLKPVTPQ